MEDKNERGRKSFCEKLTGMTSDEIQEYEPPCVISRFDVFYPQSFSPLLRLPARLRERIIAGPKDLDEERRRLKKIRFL